MEEKGTLIHLLSLPPLGQHGLSLLSASRQSSHFSSLGHLVSALPSVQVPCCFGLLVPTKLTLNDIFVPMTSSGFVSFCVFLYSLRLFCIPLCIPNPKLWKREFDQLWLYQLPILIQSTMPRWSRVS